MEELGSGTKMDENTGCAGPGSDTMKNEVEIESTIPSTKCTCGLQFGVFPLSLQDNQSLNLAEEFGKMSINFHGPAGENQRIFTKEKIEEIKQKVADYYFDPDCKVIAIPNHFVTPKKPTVLGKEGKEQQEAQIMDKHLEEHLHHELVNAARKSTLQTFIMNSFQSDDCIKQLVEKGKGKRGKDKYAVINEHEKRVMEILDIEDYSDKKLESCIEEHKKWRENPSEFQSPQNWLFKKVLRKQGFKHNSKVVENQQYDIQNKTTQHLCSSSTSPKRKNQTENIKKGYNSFESKVLYNIPEDKLENFYKYQFFNISIQEKKTEWDTIMIVPEYSAIINIEVKRGSNDSSDKLKFQKEKLNLLKDASKQTKQHFSFMQKLFGGRLSKNWVFVRAAFVPYLESVAYSTMPCGSCQQFILLEKDVDHEVPWLKQLINNKLIKSQYFDQKVYEELVAELIYHISIKNSSKFNQLISDPLTVSRETEEAFTGKTDGISGESDVPESMFTNEHKALIGKAKGLSEKSDLPDPMLTNEQKALTDIVDDKKTLYLLNNEQLQAVHSPAKFLIIDGNYGTGKTYVLKERAKKCAIDNRKEQLFYIDLTALSHNFDEHFDRTQSSVMDIIATRDFESYHNIRVITSKDLGIGSSTGPTEIINALNRFLRDNNCDHLFIDEMIIGNFVLPDSTETIYVNLKVDDGAVFKNKKIKWLETMKVNHNAVHVNLTKNMRNSQQIINLAKALVQDSTKQISCPPDTNVMGTHNFYYINIYGISQSLLVLAAVNKYFIHKPKESIVILSSEYDSNSLFESLKFLNKHLSLTIPVVTLRDFKAYMVKPEGVLVTNIHEFQGAQARNIIICCTDSNTWDNHMQNIVLRTMSFAIIIFMKDNCNLNSSVAIEDKNLHKYIYPEGEAPKCHYYHNYKYDISALTMAILDEYKLFDQDESIGIVKYSRISKDIIREANTKEFLSLPKEEKILQVAEKIKLENSELYEDVKRNISRNFADISWSYYDIDKRRKLKYIIYKPRHINYINMAHAPDFDAFSKFKNIIVFADENIDHKHEFAAWGDEHSLIYSADETSIHVELSKVERNDFDAFCRNIIILHQPKFAMIVHGGSERFCQPEGAINLIEDDNLHEHIPVTKTDLSDKKKAT